MKFCWVRTKNIAPLREEILFGPQKSGRERGAHTGSATVENLWGGKVSSQVCGKEKQYVKGKLPQKKNYRWKLKLLERIDKLKVN